MFWGFPLQGFRTFDFHLKVSKGPKGRCGLRAIGFYEGSMAREKLQKFQAHFMDVVSGGFVSGWR